jgi:hypothetical protein
VHPDEQRISSPSRSPGDIRRQVVEMAAGRLHGIEDVSAGAAGPWPDSGHDIRFSSDPGDRAAMDLYLALLQDCLPVYVRVMADLSSRAGHGSVRDNLLPVARATIDFYCEILSVKVAAFTRPAQVVRLRELMRARGLGPDIAHDMVAAYLRKEQEQGRAAADVDTLAAAHLLLGACVSYAFTAMLMGEDDLPPREEYAVGIVGGLRLSAELGAVAQS